MDKNLLALRQKQILAFTNSAEYKSLSAFYSQPSIFSALGVSRQENTHNNFIAWLLTPQNNHGLGDIPLRKLLSLLALVCTSLPHALGKLDTKTSHALVTGTYSLSNVIVERERPIDGGRIDILIRGSITLHGSNHAILIAIENKIRSTEHASQTKRYRDTLNRDVGQTDLFLGVYLTPLGNASYENLTASQCDAADFIQLNYQYLADYVIAPCHALAPEGRIKDYLAEYLLALSLPELRQNKGDVIMAISNEERDLLSRFWDAHKDLLIPTLLTLGEYVPLEDAEQKIVSEACKALDVAIKRDMTRYSWKFGDRAGYDLPKNRLVLDIIVHYVINHAQRLTLGELKRAFPDTLQGGTFGVVAPLSSADSENFKGHRRYFTETPIDLADGLAAVCTQWRKENIEDFIAAAEKLGYTISSTEVNP